MSAKLITLDGGARRGLERGLHHAARVVKITLAPKVRKAAPATKWGALISDAA